MKNVLILILGLCCGAWAGETNVLNTDGTGLARRRAVVKIPGKTVPDGIILAAMDSNAPLGKDFKLPDPLPPALDLFGTPGDYYTALAGLYTCKDLKNVEISVSELRNGVHVIGTEHVLLLEAVDFKLNPENRVLSELLVKPELKDIATGTAIGLQLLVNIPANAAPGVYTGEITAVTDSGKAVLPVRLRVMDFRLPELEESAGFYMPGHFSRKSEGRCVNYAPKSLTPENLDTYFNFYRRCRLNSPTLYHIYPKLSLIDGKVEADFGDISAFAAAMRRTGLNGKLILDLRWLTWWSNTVARVVAGNGNPVLKGDLKIYTPKGSPDTDFHPESRKYFAEALRLLLDTAKQENWPELRLVTEEEVSNSPGKRAGYDFFLPVLKELCADKTAVIDNDIGYNRKPETDRGHRDMVNHRQYNSWTEQAFADAQKDGAEVWTFNYGTHRMSFGFLQVKMGSKGRHQWADLWSGNPDESSYSYSILSDNGVITTRVMEQFHEGRLDWAACKLLAELADKLGGDDAKAARKVLTAVTADLPINGNRFRQIWGQNTPGQEADLRRWLVFTAIENARRKLSGTPAKNIAAPGAASLSVKSVAAKAENSSKLLPLRQTAGELNLDAALKPLYGHGTGPIPYIQSMENLIRAKCSTEEEFRKFAPSYCAAWLAYGREGLYVMAHGNHIQPKGGYRYQRTDNDPEMWQDDTVQFFFMIPETGHLYQLIINAAGCKTLLRDGKTAASERIKIFARSPLNKSGGNAVEALIPWSCFGLDGMPAAGNEWKFNFTREFHSWNQLTSWGRVNRSFHEVENWGRILFSGQGALQSFDKLDLPSIYEGQNRIRGRLKNNIGKNKTLSILDPSAKTVHSLPVKPGADFSVQFTVPSANTGKVWILELKDANGTSERVLLPVESLAATVQIRNHRDKAISGGVLALAADIRFPSGLDKPALCGELTSPGHRIALPKAILNAPGRKDILLNCDGLLPGNWELRLWVDGAGSITESTPVHFEVLPSPY